MKRLEKCGGHSQKGVGGTGEGCSGIRAPWTQDVEGDFGEGEETVPEVVRKVRVGR
jgi:hypothetical protein